MAVILNDVYAMPAEIVDVGDDNFVEVIACKSLWLIHRPTLSWMTNATRIQVSMCGRQFGPRKLSRRDEKGMEERRNGIRKMPGLQVVERIGRRHICQHAIPKRNAPIPQNNIPCFTAGCSRARFTCGSVSE